MPTDFKVDFEGLIFEEHGNIIVPSEFLAQHSGSNPHLKWEDFSPSTNVRFF